MNRSPTTNTTIFELLLSTPTSAERECPANSNHAKTRPDATGVPTNVPSFEPGDFVEVFDPKVHARLAFPAQIHRVLRSGDDASFNYAVYPGFGPIIPDIDPSSVHALKPWDDKAEAMCDSGDTLNAELSPCTVLHKVPNSNKYLVSHRDGGSVERYEMIPFFRIRRIVTENINRPSVEFRASFQPGDFVEVFDPRIHARLAFPAQICRVLRGGDGSSFNYTVYPGFGPFIPDIDPSGVRDLEPWDDEAEAVCDGGATLNAELSPCTVLHKVPSSNKYLVSYRGDGSVERYEMMPFFRIRRFVKEHQGPSAEFHDGAHRSAGGVAAFLTLAAIGAGTAFVRLRPRPAPRAEKPGPSDAERSKIKDNNRGRILRRLTTQCTVPESDDESESSVAGGDDDWNLSSH